MQGAGAPSGVGAPGRTRVLLLTYLLVTLDLTCLFMQFSVLPVSASLTAQAGLGPAPRPPALPQGGEPAPALPLGALPCRRSG